MLSFLGLTNIDDLFDAIPESIKLAKGSLNLDDGISEFDVLQRFETYGDSNIPISPRLISFAGGGAYDHDIASAIHAVAYRSEFLTAYTPYQPEVAQGILQALFEYQTLVSRLSGLSISNSSLYDGASALVEAINLTATQNKNNIVWMSQGVNPSYREVVKTFAKGTGHQIIEIPFTGGSTRWFDDQLDIPGTVVLAYPNYLGELEDFSDLLRYSQEKDIRVIFVYDPISMALIKSPGQLGADVAVAEGQTFGVGLNFGGPYVGLFSTKAEYARLLPGRLVGETVDSNNKLGYVTTLRTREQDIRREKASSNVCTNQTLIAIVTAIAMSWIGKAGFKKVATKCYSGSEYLKSLLTENDKIDILARSATVREFAIACPIPGNEIIDRMLEEGYLAGIAIKSGFEGTEYDNGLLIAVTEKRTRAEINGYVNALERVLK